MSDTSERLRALGLPTEAADSIAVGPALFPYGSGADGNVTIAGTVTLTRDMEYNDLIVPVGTVLVTAGFLVSVRGTLSGAGTIRWNGNDGVGATAGAALASKTFGGSPVGATGVITDQAGAAGTAATPNGGADGGAGGTGKAAGANAGGAGGVGTVPLGGVEQSYSAVKALLGWVVKSDGSFAQLLGGGSGGAGAGDGTGTGGGGASGGGVVGIAAQVCDFAGAIEAKGGIGGDSTALGHAGGGGGGGGGSIRLVTRELRTVPTFTVTGGVGGQKNGTGGTVGVTGQTGDYRVIAA